MSRINLKEGMFLGKEELQRLQEFQSELPCSLENLWLRDSNSESSISGNDYIFPLTPKHIGLKKVITESGIQGVLLHHNYFNSKYFVAGKYEGTNYLIGKNSEVTGQIGFCPSTSIVEKGSGRIYLQIASNISPYEDALISITTQGQCSFVGWSRIVNALRQGMEGRYTRIQLQSGEIYSIQSFDETTQTVQLVGGNGSFKTVSKVSFKFLPTMSPFSENTNEPLYSYEYSRLVPTMTPNTLTVGYCTVENGEIVQVVLEPYKIALPLVPRSIKSGHLGIGAVQTENIDDNAVTSEEINWSNVMPTIENNNDRRNHTNCPFGSDSIENAYHDLSLEVLRIAPNKFIIGGNFFSGDQFVGEIYDLITTIPNQFQDFAYKLPSGTFYLSISNGIDVVPATLIITSSSIQFKVNTANLGPVQFYQFIAMI